MSFSFHSREFVIGIIFTEGCKLRRSTDTNLSNSMEQSASGEAASCEAIQEPRTIKQSMFCICSELLTLYMIKSVLRHSGNVNYVKAETCLYVTYKLFEREQKYERIEVANDIEDGVKIMI
jgi:hypothetical protein